MKQCPASAKYKLSIVNFQLSIILIVAFFASSLKAQVKIGDAVNPQNYSIVEIDTTQYKGGLRMPQLTTFQRDSISDILKQATNQVAGKGLVIFNTDTKCLEFWNGSTWISLCEGVAVSVTSVPEQPTALMQADCMVKRSEELFAVWRRNPFNHISARSSISCITGMLRRAE